MQINRCRRCCLRCCCQYDKIKHKYLGDKWPRAITDAVDPSLIEWKNLGQGKIERCSRTACIWFLSIILIICGFTLIIYMLEY